MKKIYLTLSILIIALYCSAGYNSSYSESTGIDGDGTVSHDNTVSVGGYYQTFYVITDITTNMLGNPYARGYSQVTFSGTCPNGEDGITDNGTSVPIPEIPETIDLGYPHYVIEVYTLTEATTDAGSYGVARAAVYVTW